MSVPHNGHTRLRFCINTGEVISRYEHATPSLVERLASAKKVAAVGYPLGFLVAPIIAAEGWKKNFPRNKAAAQKQNDLTKKDFDKFFNIGCNNLTLKQ